MDKMKVKVQEQLR